MTKRLLFILFTFMLTMMLVACGGGASESGGEGNASEGDSSPPQAAEGESDTGKGITIKAGIGLNEAHPQYKGMEVFKEIVEEETNGEIKVEIYPSAQLGDDKQMVQAVQFGTQEITVTASAPLANFVPEVNILSFPFLFPDADVADAVLDGEPGQKLLEMLEPSGLVGLGYWEEGFYNISNNVRPIHSAEDLNGIKIRTMENAILLDIFNALGANPTPMAFSEVYTALQQGVVDAQTNPVSQIYDAKFHEVQKYVSGTNDYYGAWVFLINKEFLEGLTAEQQEIIQKAADEARDIQRQLTRDTEEEYIEKLIDEGVEYNELTDEGRQSIEEKIRPVIDKHSADIQEIADLFYEAIEAEQNK